MKIGFWLGLGVFGPSQWFVGLQSQPALVLSMIGQEICADSDCYVRVGR
jgi:hypothetical protein